ncbi:MAG: toxin-antitoxin system HicB family antitoxin [Magnetococcales bacterium]|nr:toxin-antitoxin system HicB family antitoxin [Magnetococcales bacterium]
MPVLDDYPFEIRPMTPEEGTGYLITFPDFNECFSDGATIAEAIANGMDALKCAILALEDTGFPVPPPGSGGAYSGRFVARIPKTLHANLSAKAKMEGVSLNTLVVSLLAEGMGRRDTTKVA